MKVKQASREGTFSPEEFRQGSFHTFFESGMEESASPFITPSSRNWGRNLSLKVSLCAALFLFMSFGVSFFLRHILLSQLFLLLTYFFAGIPALVGAIEDLLQRKFNIDILMTLAAFLSILIGSGQEGALLLVLFSFSESLEDAVRFKAKKTIQSLKQLAPSKAKILQPDGFYHERSLYDIVPGTKIFVHAGEIIPLDGKIIEGISYVNNIHLTGENAPILKKPGHLVTAGSQNLEGSLTIEVTHSSADSTLEKIIGLIMQAQEAKPKLQRWLDKLTDRYAITVVLLSLFLALILPLFVSINYLGSTGSIYRALSFLIAASPCALVIAIPIAYLSSINSCARKGILIKGSYLLDDLAECSELIFDKTGTLTKGELDFLGMESLGNIENRSALLIACSLSKHSLHPISKALIQQAETQGLLLSTMEHFRQHPGLGVEGFYQQLPVFMGNIDFILPRLPSHLKETILSKISTIKNNGEMYTLLFIGENSVSIFRFQELLRPNVVETVKKLKKCGLNLTLLTGDHYSSAENIANALGIPSFKAHLKPEDKLNFISELAQRKKSIMVGDGMNDAPALARATVGISMGKGGSGVAIDASDIVLLHNHLENLPWLIDKSRFTKKIVRQNLILATSVILFFTIPALLCWVPLWVSVLLHEGGTVLVGMNALRLLKK